MKERWLEDLKRRSESFERTAPDDLWEEISQSLSERGAAEYKRRNATMAYWLRRCAAVAAVVLVAVVAGLTILFEPQPIRDDANAERELLVADNRVATDVGREPEVPRTVQVMSHGSVQGVIAQVRTSEDASECVNPEPAIDDTDTAIVSVPPKQNADATKRSVMDGYGQNVRHGDGRARRNQEYRHTAKHGKWSAGLYAGNMTGGNDRSTGYRNFELGANPFSTMPRQETWNTSPMANIMFNNLEETPETKIKHSLPLSFGATVRYSLSRRCGIESGLVYTLLKSELTSGSGNDYYATDQVIHYIGIPVKFNFVVWSNDMFRVYMSAGGMAQIPLSGNAETEYVNGGVMVERKEESVDVDRLQWSVSGAVGFQYNFIDRLGVYVEPGIGYYFDDGSNVLTIYKDKPFNFNFQVGLRFELD